MSLRAANVRTERSPRFVSYLAQSLALNPFDGWITLAITSAMAKNRAAFVRGMILARRQRDIFFPAKLFSEPAWDILLALYEHHLFGSSVTVSSLSRASSAAATTALRYIDMLVEEGLATRQGDPHDRRKTLITMTAKAGNAMGAYLDWLKTPGTDHTGDPVRNFAANLAGVPTNALLAELQGRIGS